MPTTQEIQDWKGQTLNGPDGKIGKIDEIYLDDQTGEPEWALVNTGLFGTRSSFVPIADARADGGAITVPFDKDTVKGAPNVEEDGHLSPEEESELFRYYGRGDTDTTTQTTTGRDTTDRDVSERDTTDRGTTDRDTVGHDTSGRTTDDAMTRSEEELRVGTREREAGKVRLRKYVVTENVTKTVPVSHEEVRLEREPITDANVGAATDGPAISEEEHEVTLRAEEPVVEKTTVPKERVRLDKDVVQDETQVTEEVRKERIDTDHDGGVDRV
jgi:uncharacterized protein (TIGR02271 family)